MHNAYVDTTNGMEFMVISLGDHLPDYNGSNPYSQNERLQHMIDLGIQSEKLGYDIFGVGESHQKEFISSSPAVLLSHLAALTKKIKLSSATTVLSLHDPVRVFEDFTTLDQLSNGRAEILLGRGSRHGAYSLFGYDIRDYDELFAEKLDLLQQLNTQDAVSWSGKYRSALNQARFFPEPYQNQLPIWRVVGQHTSSAKQAGEYGLPANFSFLWTGSNLFNRRVAIYRDALKTNGYQSSELPIGTSGTMVIADDVDTAIKKAYKGMQHIFKLVHGIDMDKRNFIQAKDYKHPMLIGNAQLLRDKIMYQYETFHFQRLTLEVDNGSHPNDVKQQLEHFSDKVMPYIKTHTREN